MDHFTKKIAAVLGLIGACAIVVPACSNDAKDAETPRAIEATPVVVAPVRYDTFVERIEALGTTVANESVVVTADVTGRVVRINFRDGQKVEKGAVLVELDNDEEQALLAAAQANLTTQRTQYRRLLDLVRQKSIAQTTLDEQANALKTAESELEIARVRLRDRTIEAPFSGQLGIRRVSPGALVNSGAEIVTLDDLRVMKLDFSIPETYLSVLSPGLEIEVESAAYPDRLFKGEVTTIDSRIDPVTRTVVVRAELPNPDGLLRPGMLMTVDLIRGRTRSLVIPEEGLTPLEDRQYVYRVDGEDKIERLEVSIGRRRSGEVEVLGGLEAGDRVVVEGTTRIRPGMPVTVIGTRGDASESPPAAAAIAPTATTR